jgi:hypothetical protein
MGASARTNPERTTNDATSVPTKDRRKSELSSRFCRASSVSAARLFAAAVPSAPPAPSPCVSCAAGAPSRARARPGPARARADEPRRARTPSPRRGARAPPEVWKS